tara:strand:- start:52 stop:210 length:159 start_codon:yes stop_codon:yes gene_type:complete
MDYTKDTTRYGASDARIKAAGKNKDKLLDAARQHPDRKKAKNQILGPKDIYG